MLPYSAMSSATSSNASLRLSTPPLASINLLLSVVAASAIMSGLTSSRSCTPMTSRSGGGLATPQNPNRLVDTFLRTIVLPVSQRNDPSRLALVDRRVPVEHLGGRH